MCWYCRNAEKSFIVQIDEAAVELIVPYDNMFI